ncbi:lipoyl synthase 1 [Roseibium sp. TrichSKD4]|uniref:hypothetical protein n=1 Tax=Roseibium sp. TrichSKD4 TaxID=744980 RepID=UPI0001E56246|nr:hypothetical protein [Roseibium sp. TrichSKD4]EFO33805.1 lipoyl synthase 1 [Roseibium sp. TrichSKD4]
MITLLKYAIPFAALGACAFIGLSAAAANSETSNDPRNIASTVLKFLAHVITHGRNA